MSSHFILTTTMCCFHIQKHTHMERVRVSTLVSSFTISSVYSFLSPHYWHVLWLLKWKSSQGISMTFIHRHLVKQILPNPPQLGHSSCSGEESFPWLSRLRSLGPCPQPWGLILPSSLSFAQGRSALSRQEDLTLVMPGALIIIQRKMF